MFNSDFGVCFFVRVVSCGALVANKPLRFLVAFQLCTFSSHFRSASLVKVRSLQGLVLAALRGKLKHFCWWLFGFGCIVGPNKSVKGTRRPLAVLKFWFLSRFGSFAWLSLAARPLP